MTHGTRDGVWRNREDGLWFHSGPYRFRLLPRGHSPRPKGRGGSHGTIPRTGFPAAPHPNNFGVALQTFAREYPRGVSMATTLPEQEQATLRRGINRARRLEANKPVLAPFSLRARPETVAKLRDWGARRGYDQSTVARFAMEIFADLVTRFPSEGDEFA